MLLVLLLLACTNEPATAPDAAPERPSDGPVQVPASPEPPTGDGAQEVWTAGVTRQVKASAPGGLAVLREVRTGRHEGYDRVVFEFDGGLPSYEVEYVDRPVRRCGSGEPVELPGDGWLEVRFTDAQAHTEQGAATVADRERSLDLGVARKLVLTCDFEGHVTWVLAVASPNPYRLDELQEPTRLVVDVKTP